MADGVELNAGTGGATCLTDDTGATGHAQVIKLAISTDGSPTLIPAEANNGLDVDVTRVQGTVSVQSNAANLATETSLSALAGDVGDTADAAATAGSTGTLHAKQRLMTSQLDSIKTATESLATQTADFDTGAGTDTTVMLGIALPGNGGAVVGGTSTNPVQVNDASTQSYLTFIAGAAGIDGSGGMPQYTLVVGGTDGANPQTLKTDTSGELQVDVLSCASHPVTNAGTFAVQVDGSALTSLQLIDDVVRSEDEASGDGHKGAVVLFRRTATPANTSGADLDYEVPQMSAGRVWTSATVDAALPAGTNAIGKLAANSGVDIGDVDVTTVGTITPGTAATSLGKAEDAAHSTGDVGVLSLGVRLDTPNTAPTSADADYGYVALDKMGQVRTALYEGDFAVLGTNHVKKYYTSTGAATDGIVWSPAAGKRWYVTDLIVNVSAATTVTFEDDKSGGDEVVMKFELAANSGVTHSFKTPWFSGEDAADLLVTTTAGNIYITITGYEI